MLFTSHQFLFVFLPLVVLSLYLVRRHAAKGAAIWAMVAASLLFYYFNGLSQLPVLVLSILLNHACILLWMRAENPRVKATIIGLAIAGNLAVLGYYKYSTFLVQQYEIVTSVINYRDPIHTWWAPISYYYLVYPWGYAGVFLALPLPVVLHLPADRLPADLPAGSRSTGFATTHSASHSSHT